MNPAAYLSDPVSLALGLAAALLVGALLWRGARKAPTTQTPLWQQKGLAVLFAAKWLAGVVYTLIYWWGYNGLGDTFGYYEATDWIARCWQERPDVAAQLYTSYRFFHNLPSQLQDQYSGLLHYDNAKALLFPRLMVPLHLATGGSFWFMLTAVTALSAWGHWQMYRVLRRRFTVGCPWLELAVLALPGVLFWTSGFTRDALAFGCLGGVVWAANAAVCSATWPKRLANSLWLVLFLLLLTGLKPEIGLCLVAVGLWLGGLRLIPGRWAALGRRTAQGLWLLAAPSVLFVALSFTRYPPQYLLEYVTLQYNYDIALAVHSPQTPLTGREYQDDTPAATIARAPLALFTALYRPLPHEANAPLPLLAALEQTALLAISLWLLVLAVRRRWARQAPPITLLLWGLLAFCLLYLTFVGLSTANFGALARFRSYALPFWYALLVYGAWGRTNERVSGPGD